MCSPTIEYIKGPPAESPPLGFDFLETASLCSSSTSLVSSEVFPIHPISEFEHRAATLTLSNLFSSEGLVKETEALDMLNVLCRTRGEEIFTSVIWPKLREEANQSLGNRFYTRNE